MQQIMRTTQIDHLLCSSVVCLIAAMPIKAVFPSCSALQITIHKGYAGANLQLSRSGSNGASGPLLTFVDGAANGGKERRAAMHGSFASSISDIRAIDFT
jgi:hypothetical protein